MSDKSTNNQSSQLTLIARRTIRASAERLFVAWTQPEHFMAWWGPKDNVDCPEAVFDVRVGGSYRIANKFPNGDVVWIVGEYVAIEPPRKLVFDWRIEAGSATSERVTVRFEERGDATDVIVIHERIPDETTRGQHEQGWMGCLDGLVKYFSGR